MKTLTFIVSLLFAIAALQAQDYQISFTGSGQSTSVDSIQVLNLTQGTTLSLNGDDVLHLLETAGINVHAGNENTVKIYPNPMITSTIVKFFNANEQTVCLEIFNEMGELIAKQSTPVQRGTQIFEISGLSSGIYTVNVSAADWKYAAKLISLGNNPENIRIKHLSTNDESAPENALKSIKDLVQMQYNDGEMIQFKAFAGNYATVFNLIPTQSQTVNFEFISCTDGHGNNYAVVIIGTQTWMAENMNYETENSWCQGDDPANCEIYGRLYTWNAALTACPDGWHLSSDDEWKILEMYLGMSQIEADKTGLRGTDEGKKLKSTSGWYSNGNGTDAVGFMALPGGYRGSDGTYFGLGKNGMWWMATEQNSTYAWTRRLYYNQDKVGRESSRKDTGFIVRCLQD